MLRSFQIAALCCVLGLPAWAQETAAVEQPEDQQTLEIPNPAMAHGVPQPMQSLVIMVDGEPRSWAPLEKGTDVAWQAYQNGNFPQAVPVFVLVMKNVILLSCAWRVAPAVSITRQARLPNRVLMIPSPDRVADLEL